MKRLHIIGGKNHGKTTLVVELVKELTRRGVSVERYHGAANAQFASAERMVVLGVVALIGQDPPRLKVSRSLPHGGREVGRVLAGAARATAPTINCEAV
jgi:hypothetical protein